MALGINLEVTLSCLTNFWKENFVLCEGYFIKTKLKPINFQYINLQFPLSSKFEFYINFYVFNVFEFFTKT